MPWPFGSSKKQAPAESAIALDKETLRQLAKAGGNLSLPTEIVNYLYLPDEIRARQAASELATAGYRVEVRPAAKGPSWLALAKIDMVPSSENVGLVRQRFEGLASQLGGEYDGWEAAVTN
jgi:regulator of ribonuclease activity B